MFYILCIFVAVSFASFFVIARACWEWISRPVPKDMRSSWFDLLVLLLFVALTAFSFHLLASALLSGSIRLLGRSTKVYFSMNDSPELFWAQFGIVLFLALGIGVFTIAVCIFRLKVLRNET